MNEIDSNLYNSLSHIKEELKLNYPDLNWGGEIHYKKQINNLDNTSKISSKNIFFSGGIDSFFTFFSIVSKNKRLILVRGADIKLDDDDGWSEVKRMINNIKLNYNVKAEFIETNLISFLNSDKLNYISGNINDWWSRVQHGPGFAALVAPINKNYYESYISATHSKDFNTPWGSSPKIDNLIRYSNHKIIHFGYDHTRQQKIKKIIKLINNNKFHKPVLRVCYKNKNIGSQNCCNCEKCFRTITGLVVAGSTPKDFGFNISINEAYLRLKKTLENNEIVFDENRLFMWQDIQKHIESFTEYYSFEDRDKFIKWFKNFDFDNYLLKNYKKTTFLNDIYQILKQYRFGRFIIRLYKSSK